ncbi:DNA-directed RNA polymerase III subunit RPC6 [Kwoniella heveanensis CBS 569]|nr:DNA-directed RNA polymerase III subunit RPC6 [Kwoniella heveanensis CBS 569]
MTSMSNSDQQVWKKVLAAKNKYMTLQQIEASFPSMSKKAVLSSVGNLVKLRLFSTSKSKEDDKTTIFHAHHPEEAKQKATLTQEQSIVLQIIGAAGNRGIASAQIGRQIGNETMPQAILRKTVRGLENAGHIKQFKPVNAPTTVYFVLSHLKPPEEISGGVWFDDNKEYDQQLVETICTVLLSRVRSFTYADQKKRSEKDRKLVPNALILSSKNYPQLTPQALRIYVNKLGVTSANLSVKNVMECMRALELDGLVEAIKPLGGVYIADEDVAGAGGSDDDDKPSSSKRKKLDIGVDDEDDLDEDERERRKELALRKAKEKAKEKKRRERAKEKEKKEKERRKKKEEKKRKEKEREKKRKKKEKDKKKEKEKKKRKKIDSDDSDADSDDRLVSIRDEGKKRKKRSRSSSISSVASSASSSSVSSSSSSSSSSSVASSSSVSSVASSQLDEALVPLKPKSSLAAAGAGAGAGGSFIPTLFPGGTGGGLTDLTDTAVIYRATNRLDVSLGQTQAPCGKCPVFAFCEEDGPVNPDGCRYYSDWLGDNVGGWEKDALAKMRPELIEEEPQPDLNATAAGGVDGQGQGLELNGDVDGEDFGDGGEANGEYADGGEGGYGDVEMDQY